MSLFSDLAESIPSTGGNFYKPVLGDNRIRIVSKPIKIFRPPYSPQSTSKPRYCLTQEGSVKYECPDVKFGMWIIDRTDGSVKSYEAPAMVMNAIADLSEMEGYKFEELPPYDIIIKKKKEGDRTSYAVFPFPERSELTEDEKKKIADKGDLVQFLREKADDASMVAPF